MSSGTDKTSTQVQTLRRLAAGLDILRFFSLRRYFSELYTSMQKEVGRYSYRSYAADLGYGSTNFMHLVCSGKRHISPQTARVVADALDFDSNRKKYFLTLSQFEVSKSPESRNAFLEKLGQIIESNLPTPMDKDQFAYFSYWHFAVIRELACRPDFEATPAWISKRILPPISEDKAAEGLELLKRIGYLALNPKNDRWEPSETHVRSPLEARSTALFRFHNQLIELGRTSLSRIDGWKRDISAVTVTLDEDSIQQVKREIQELRARVLKLSESCHKPGVPVYQLNIQFFPVSEDDLP